LPAWSSERNAAIALVNTYTRSGDRWPGRSRRVAVRAADQAPFVRKKFEWGKESWFQHELSPQLAVLSDLDYLTHALLEVPPGRYVLDPFDSEQTSMTVDLTAGQLIVVNVTRKFIGADEPVLEDLAWWAKWQSDRGRHAFLEDPRPVVPNVFVETWFMVPPSEASKRGESPV
jgi:hypothetical protein